MPDDQVALFAGIPPLNSTVELPHQVRPGVTILSGLEGPTEAFPGACPSQLRQVHRGLHPMGWPMPGPAGETCGSCSKCWRLDDGHHTHLKCAWTSTQTRSYATDTRARWPACSRWAAKPEEK